MKLKTCLPQTRTLQPCKDEAFEGIATDPELNLKRVIAGPAQNKIFMPPSASAGFVALQEAGKKNEFFFFTRQRVYG